LAQAILAQAILAQAILAQATFGFQLNLFCACVPSAIAGFSAADRLAFDVFTV